MLDVRPEETLASLRARVAEHTGLAEAQIRFADGSRLLTSTDAVVPGSTLSLVRVPRPRLIA